MSDKRHVLSACLLVLTAPRKSPPPPSAQNAAVLEDGIEVQALGLRMAFDTFESNVLFVLRFMIDAGVVGGCWCELPAGKYRVGGQDGERQLSTCQIDAHINYR